MYKNADEFTKDEQKEKTSDLRLAEVTSINGETPHLTFYGEDQESQKDYKFLSAYKPCTGDTVCVGRINESWIILGKVTNAYQKPKMDDVWRLNNPYGGSAALLKYEGSSYYTFEYENGSGVMDIGSSGKKCRNIYATTGTIQTSDEREKVDVKEIDPKYAKLLLRLTPKSFKLIDGTSGRTHIGFLAQDVEKEMEELGIDPKDFAGFVKSPILDENKGEVIDYAYGLRYEEFIAIIVYMLQMIVRKLDWDGTAEGTE